MKRATVRYEHRKQTEPVRSQRGLTVEIERIVPGGLGIGHAEKMTVLAPFTAPGDTVRVGIDKVRGSTAFSVVQEIHTPGPERVEPQCPHYGVCGGCDFQHLSYDGQLEAKSAIVADCFRRIGGIELEEIELVPSPLQWGYRIRADWAVDSKQRIMGYHQRNSRDVFDVHTCPILDPVLDLARISLRDGIQSGEIEVKSDILGASSAKEFTISPKIPEFPGSLLMLEVAGERYGFDATSFFQANASILPEFIEYVIQQATDGEETIEGEAIDLYSGVGLFTLPLARRFAHVTGVETNPKSASFAHESIRAAGLTNTSISGLPVDQWLRRKAGMIEAISTIVLDPPRTGAEPDVLSGIVQLAPERIVYVSCDPATLARDLKVLIAAEYELGDVRAFDMFPQTHHVECVATLTRSA